MRVLLIDNRDSYTYNLHALLHRAFGRAPEVRQNDDPVLGARFVAGFDAVVLSPGPGRPGRAGDVGVVPALVAASTLPVLGVCLGHQVLGHLAGAAVVPAPQPRHGHVTRVGHRGHGIFAALPQGFAAVRYHSLCLAEPLPAVLRAQAWSEDGVLMAFSHARRPWWGVQFHPESVATEHGLALVGAWRDLCVGAGAPQALVPPPVPVVPAAPIVLDPDPARWVVRARRVRAEVSAAVVHERLYAHRRYAFWLDSGRRGAGTGRFSFLGAPDGPHGEVLSARVGDSHVSVLDGDGDVRGRLRGDALVVLERRLAARSTVADPALPFALQGGYVGCFSYEVKALTGFADDGSPTGAGAPAAAGSPDAVWVSATRYLVVDHDEAAVWIVSCAPAGCPDPGAREWADAVEEVLASRSGPDDGAAPPDAAQPRSAGTDPADLELLLLTPRARYLEQVGACLDLLRQGESYEVCLTTQARTPSVLPPLVQYRRQRAANPAPYAAFLALGDVSVLCSSPERFLTVDPGGAVETRPIKGTAPRGADPAEDEALRHALATSGKTRAENLMIVDLVRHDLGRVCEPGSVVVPDLGRVESYATVHQLVSTVRGTLAPGVGATGAFRACFPPGSMTGAPKVRTVQIIARLEGRARGLYSGSLGFFSTTGAADLAVVIRTAVVAGGVVSIGAGGAVVLASDPAEEHEEVLLKVRAPLVAALGR